MDAEKLHVKLFADPAHAPKLEEFIPVLHRFIKDRALGELLVDVADYSHVHHGPGVVLVGHASDYYIDTQGGRLGLLYSRKRQPVEAQERLKDALRRAVNACRLLEQDTSLRVRFKTNEVLVRFVDRLRFSNDEASFAKVRPEILEFFGNLFENARITAEQIGTRSELLSIRVQADAAPELEALMQRLGGPPQPSA